MNMKTTMKKRIEELEKEIERLQTKADQKYNGWTNFETWRINLEYFDGYQTNRKIEPDELKKSVEEYIDENVNEKLLIHGWVNAFISEVNWYEIAKHINEDNGFKEDDDE